MKKINAIISAVVVLAMSSSCVKEVLNPESQSSGAMTISVSAESPSPEGKTTLDETNVNWVSGDAISILYGTENKQFTTTGSGGAADFTGDAAPGVGDAVYAVYPYSAANAISGDSLEVTIPAIQYARAESYADGAFVSVGQVVDNKVSMYNVGGLIKLPIAGSDITSVTLRAKYDASNTVIPVSGVFHVGFSAGLPVAKGYSTSHMVKLLPPAGETVFTPGNYFIAVASVSMAQGFDLIYTKAAARGIKSTDNPCPIERSHCVPIKTAPDAGLSFTAGRFIEISFVNEETHTAIQPFSENLNTGSSNPSGGVVNAGIYFQKCAEEYMYRLDTVKTRGFFLVTGAGRTGLYTFSSNSKHKLCYFGLPHFINKKLRSIEEYTTVTKNSTSHYALAGSKVSQSVVKGDDYKSVFKSSQVLPYNGNWWYGSATWQYGMGYGQIDIPDSGEDTDIQYFLTTPQIRKLVLFYEGADVEEVTSVKATVPSEIATENLPADISGSFKSWNYGTGGAAYAAGIEYKLATASVWNSVTGIVTGQTFKAQLPAGLDINDYVLRPWAGVDGASGAKIYGKEYAFSISGEVTEKTLTYNFLQGEPSTWISGSTATQWPFDEASYPKKTQVGTKVTLIGAARDTLVADYTMIPSEGSKLTIGMSAGRGWQIRNQTNAPFTTSDTYYFTLSLPRFSNLALTSITMSSFYPSTDKFVILNEAGTNIGGTAKKPTRSGSSPDYTYYPAVWNLSSAKVNEVIRIRSYGTSGFFFEPSSIVLHYEKPTK